MPPDCRPDDDDFAHKVLTVGDGDFGYSVALSLVRSDLKIVGTNFNEGGSNRQIFRGHYGRNLTIYEDVDARHLEVGEIGRSRYRAIIFNNPYANTGLETAELIRKFKASARNVLLPGGEIHINVTQELLINYRSVASELGVSDNRRLQVSILPTFGPSKYGPGTEYFAPFVPRYSSGGLMEFYWQTPDNARYLKNFVLGK
jgi:hypothetical protein